MRWLFKTLIRLLVLAVIAFLVWAWFADLPAPVEERTIPLPSPSGQSGPSGTAGTNG